MFILFFSTLALVVEREAQPYLTPSTSMSVYILQWQVVLFIQGLLLVDSDLTNSTGNTTIGVSLLALNLIMVMVIAFGAKETVSRASRAIERASKDTSTAIRRASTLPVRRTRRPSDAVETEVEMGDIFANNSMGAADTTNPLAKPGPIVWSEHKDDDGHVYWYNVLTEESTWHRPPEAQPKQPQPGTDEDPELPDISEHQEPSSSPLSSPGPAGIEAAIGNITIGEEDMKVWDDI